jgi:hypothetical protein
VSSFHLDSSGNGSVSHQREKTRTTVTLSLSENQEHNFSERFRYSKKKNARAKVGSRQPIEEGFGSDQGQCQLRLLGGGVLALGHGFEPRGLVAILI